MDKCDHPTAQTRLSIFGTESSISHTRYFLPALCAVRLCACECAGYTHSLLSHVNYINIGAVQCVAVAFNHGMMHENVYVHISQIRLFFELFLFNSQMEYDLWFVFCE